MLDKKDVVSIIKSNISQEIFTPSSRREKDQILKDNPHHVYMFIGDGEIYVLGEGIGSRSNLLFEGYRAPAHLKALVTAAAFHTCKDIVRVIIPTKSKEEALMLETHLKNLFNFHADSLDTKANKIINARCSQLGYSGIDDLPNDILFAFESIVYATGTDIGTFKKNIKRRPDRYAGISSFVKSYVGGFYTDL